MGVWIAGEDRVGDSAQLPGHSPGCWGFVEGGKKGRYKGRRNPAEFLGRELSNIWTLNPSLSLPWR